MWCKRGLRHICFISVLWSISTGLDAGVTGCQVCWCGTCSSRWYLRILWTGLSRYEPRGSERLSEDWRSRKNLARDLFLMHSVSAATELQQERGDRQVWTGQCEWDKVFKMCSKPNVWESNTAAVGLTLGSWCSTVCRCQSTRSEIQQAKSFISRCLYEPSSPKSNQIWSHLDDEAPGDGDGVVVTLVEILKQLAVNRKHCHRGDPSNNNALHVTRSKPKETWSFSLVSAVSLVLTSESEP